jgi:beta-RFAP synthase
LVPSGGVTVEAPARLHFGLFQMSHAYATSYMGLGGAVSEPSWSLQVAASGDGGDSFDGVQAELADYALDVCRRLRVSAGFPAVRVRARRIVPLHVGLGAKTSFGCAVLAGLAALFELAGEWTEYRRLLHRAGASGVGIHSAVRGGIIMDAGHILDEGERLRPSSARPGKPVPPMAAAWAPDFLPQMVLARPVGLRGLHGSPEDTFFSTTLPLPDEEARLVAGVVLYELVPALARKDAAGFVAGLVQLQDLGFKRVEWEAQPDSVLELRRFAVDHGATAAVLSSVGPTLAIFSDDPARLAQLIRSRCRAHAVLSSFTGCGIRVGGSCGPE